MRTRSGKSYIISYIISRENDIHKNIAYANARMDIHHMKDSIKHKELAAFLKLDPKNYNLSTMLRLIDKVKQNIETKPVFKKNNKNVNFTKYGLQITVFNKN